MSIDESFEHLKNCFAARRQGEEASDKDIPSDECPYTDSEERIFWLQGWHYNEAQRLCLNNIAFNNWVYDSVKDVENMLSSISHNGIVENALKKLNTILVKMENR